MSTRGADLHVVAERAAIAEHDGGLMRCDAETMVARAQGFSDSTALFRAAGQAWLARLDVLARQSPAATPRILAARQFIEGGWADQAAALGWTEIALFGLCPRKRWARRDCMGAAWFGPARVVTAEAVIYPSGEIYRRAQQAFGAVAPWRGEG